MSLLVDDRPCDPLPVLYRDDALVAVTKPAGLFVHRTEMDRRVRHVLMQTVRNQLRQPVFLIHRLDRPTSGIVLLGLSSAVAAAASELFRERQVQKTYLAVVRGYTPETDCVQRPLTSPEVVSDEALPARTDYSTQARYEIPLRSDRFPTTRCSLIQATPRTGRFHQIRRHLNGVNHPVLGDTSHGDSRQNRFFRTHFGLSRLLLHASGLQLPHPLTGEPLDIRCPPPADMVCVLEQLTPHRVEAA